MTAPDGYKLSGQSYSFRTPKDGGNVDLSINFKNTKIEDPDVIISIDPEDVPEGWIIEEEEIPAGGWELDDTPKTGVENPLAIMLLFLAALTGITFIGNGVHARRKATYTRNK